MAHALFGRDDNRFDFVQVDNIDWIESANGSRALLRCCTTDCVFNENLAAPEGNLDAAQFICVQRGL